MFQAFSNLSIHLEIVRGTLPFPAIHDISGDARLHDFWGCIAFLHFIHILFVEIAAWL